MRPIPDDCYVYVGVKSAGSGGRHTALAQGEALIRKRLSVLLGTLQMLRVWTVLAALLLAVIIVASLRPLEANAQATLPLGFHEKVVISGLSEPSNVEFSPRKPHRYEGVENRPLGRREAPPGPSSFSSRAN